MKKTLLAAVFAGFLPTLGHAADPASGFTDAQRKEIVAIVRQALKADPSILRDAVSSLEADNQAKDAAEAKGAIAANQKALFNQFGDPQAGNPNGDVTVVEFYDPRCPYCRRMLPGIAQMLKKDPGVRLVFKDIPVLGPASVMESRAILAAQAQGAYLKMQTALMTNPAQPSEEMIRETATKLGLDASKLLADMKSQAVTQRLEDNLKLAHALNVQGTPNFVVGEQLIPGAVDTAQLEDAVSKARKHS